MSKQLNHIDQHINQALKSYEMPFNPDDWDLMNQQLDKSFGKSIAITWSLKCLKFIAVAVVLLSTLYGFKFVVHDKANSTVSNSILVTATSNSDNNTSEKITKTPTTENLSNSFAEKITTQSAKTSFQKNSPLMDKELLVMEELKKEGVEAGALNSNTSTVSNFKAASSKIKQQKNTQQKTIATINNTVVRTVKEKRAATKTIKKNQAGKANATHFKRNILPVISAINSASASKNNFAPVNSLATISPSLITSSMDVAAVTRINVPSVVSNTPASKWSIGIHTGTKKLWANINNMEARINNGISVTFKVHPFIAIETGATYLQQKVLSANLKNITVMAESTASSTQQQQGNSFSLVNSRIKTLEIPLLAKLFMRSPQKKLAPYVAVGPSMQFKLKEQYYYEYKDRDGTVLSDVGSVNIKQDENIAHQWVMGNVNTGLHYQVSKKVSLQLEGQAQMSMKKYLIDRTMLHQNLTVNPNQHIYALGARLGLNYHF